MNTLPTGVGKDSLGQERPIKDVWAELLIQHGFIVKEDAAGNKVRSNYDLDPVKGIFVPKPGKKYDPSHALQEFAEEIDIATPYVQTGAEYIPTSYPPPLLKFHIMYENFNMGLEENYFWLVDHIRFDQGFSRAYKIRDIFTATENSAFFGASQQRLGIQQDRVQQYLATIGKMTKDLFQLVRELRILDEKLQPRREWKQSKSADATLKSEYIDLVENRGGQTSPGSVYGLAQQLGYATLPDLFFNTQAYTLEGVDAVVDQLEFNKNVKTVLKRKLYQFVNWKLKTDHELESRRRFTLKYLRQHWDIIEMYMNWIKPYLRHIARLQMNDDRLDDVDLIGAFEQSFVETEALFAKPGAKSMEVIILTMNFRTRPTMSYQQEGYQRGPIHTGLVDIALRAYEWDSQVIDMYLKYRKKEDLYMLGVVDKSVQAAMEALGEELEHYLAEAGEPKYKDKLDAEKAAAEKAARKRGNGGPGMFAGAFEPFAALFSGFGDIFPSGDMGSLFSGGSKGKPKAFPFPSAPPYQKIGKNLGTQLYQTMKNYKKSKNMLSWG